MKTIQEWLDTLPDGYRERANANLYSTDRLIKPCDPGRSEKTMSAAISAAFEWLFTPEKYQFWEDVYYHYTPANRPLPPLPTTTSNETK